MTPDNLPGSINSSIHASRSADPERLAAPDENAGRVDRRALILGSGAAAVGAAATPLLLRAAEKRAEVFIARGQRYDSNLVPTIREGLLSTGMDPDWLRGRRVLLKPNMIEPSRSAPQMTTNPAMVRATAEVFRRWGATVTVGEAPGHVRDTEMALVESGIGEALSDEKLAFADLNYQEVGWRPNKTRISPLPGLYFPSAVLDADLVVSMPKLKTHHWVGITASLKNLYGTLPGIVYGWPKNVLHHAGIPETVVDINAAVGKTITVIDGITCMEGDGPIMGSPKQLGIVVVSTNLTAADATCARIMGFDPALVHYLHLADGVLGPVSDWQIKQCGERWQELVSPFQVIDQPHIRRILVREPGVLTS
jgi:uncharacterized protein (DUF362 family)